MVPSVTSAIYAALVGADSREPFEVARVRLGHHDLLVGEDRPPPTGMSDAPARPPPPPPPEDPPALGEDALEDDALEPASAAVPGSLLPHAASSGTLTPAAARPPKLRRVILSVMMRFSSSGH